MPTWLAILNAIATIALAASAVTIVRGQLDTANEKLKSDIYERRWQVYSDLRRLSRSARDGTKVRISEIEDIQDRARFLFDNNANKKIGCFIRDIIMFDWSPAGDAKIKYCSIDEL